MLVLFSSLLSAAELAAVYTLSHHTYATGPTSGQIKYQQQPNLVCHHAQHVMGFSEVIQGEASNVLWMLTDSGYGKQTDSADFIPRIYEISIADAPTPASALYLGRFISFSDPDKRLSFPIQAEYTHYYRQKSLPEVPAIIRQSRLLTGADIDPESIVMDAHGDFWIGDEYGPFLFHSDSHGKLLRDVVSLPDNLYSADHPLLGTQHPRIKQSGGFEAMSIAPDRRTLYVMLEKTLKEEVADKLRLYTFDISTQAYLHGFRAYPLDDATHGVSAMAMLNANQLLVLEDNLKLHPEKQAAVQKIYMVDLAEKNQTLKKTLLLDLMQLKNPQHLQIAMPNAKHLPIDESLEIVNAHTLRLANDNNGWGNTFIKEIHLDQPLPYTPPIPTKTTPSWQQDTLTINTSSFDDERVFPKPFFKDNHLLGWLITIAYLALSIGFFKVAHAGNQGLQPINFWSITAMVMFILFLNKQMDMQTLVIDFLKHYAIQQHWYAYRKPLQAMFSLLALAFISVIFFKNRFALYQFYRLKPQLIVGLGMLMTFFMLRMFSINHVDQVIPYHKQFAVFQHLLELTAQLVLLDALYQRKSNPALI